MVRSPALQRALGRRTVHPACPAAGLPASPPPLLPHPLLFAWTAGLDFTRIIPVVVTTVLLTALGVSAALQDPSQWAFAAGPAACLALSAGIIPRSVAPMILTGNAGRCRFMPGRGVPAWHADGA